jgi:hypothetical protein
LHFVNQNAAYRSGRRSCCNADQQGRSYDRGCADSGDGTDRSAGQCPLLRCVQARAATGTANQNYNR